MSELIVSVSGVRGIVGKSLTPEVAVRFATAFGTEMKKGRVLLATDGRPSGRMLKHAVTAGLMATGCTVEDLGVAPTPTVGVAVRALGAAGAMQISASHNPAPWNGLKLFGADGAVLPAAKGASIAERYRNNSATLCAWDGIGETRVPPDVLSDHIRAVTDCISVANIASGKPVAFVDANGGAGGPLASRLLSELGCEVVSHNCDADGVFHHEPEPTPAHLADVAPWVVQTKSHVGFALDPDADRLALMDENGVCISEELTLALAVKYRLSQAKGPVVVNMSTSRVIEDLARAAGCDFHRSAVGEANVVEMMRRVGALVGGEGNGGVIDPRVGWVRDPFIGMALILSLMVEEGKTISELVDDLPRYAMRKEKYELPREKLAPALAKLETAWPGAMINKLDGLRVDGPDWWVHVRPSNTEPVVRVIAEAPTEERVSELIAQAAGTFHTS